MTVQNKQHSTEYTCVNQSLITPYSKAYEQKSSVLKQKIFFNWSAIYTKTFLIFEIIHVFNLILQAKNYS